MTKSPDYGTTGRCGECDRCHDDRQALYEFEEDEEGGWAYCGPCARLIASLRRKRNRQEREETAEHIARCNERDHQDEQARKRDYSLAPREWTGGNW